MSSSINMSRGYPKLFRPVLSDIFFYKISLDLSQYISREFIFEFKQVPDIKNNGEHYFLCPGNSGSILAYKYLNTAHNNIR